MPAKCLRSALGRPTGGWRGSLIMSTGAPPLPLGGLLPWVGANVAPFVATPCATLARRGLAPRQALVADSPRRGRRVVAVLVVAATPLGLPAGCRQPVGTLSSQGLPRGNRVEATWRRVAAQPVGAMRTKQASGASGGSVPRGLCSSARAPGELRIDPQLPSPKVRN